MSSAAFKATMRARALRLHLCAGCGRRVGRRVDGSYPSACGSCRLYDATRKAERRAASVYAAAHSAPSGLSAPVLATDGPICPDTGSERCAHREPDAAGDSAARE